jgi:heat shock protein HslJ
VKKLAALSTILMFLAFTAFPLIGLSESGASVVAGAAPDAIRQPVASAFLPGQTWRLVEIVSMNNRIDTPDDGKLYTVTFLPDGTVQIRSDCNRSTGSWTSTTPGKLEFGAIATSHAQCPPDSLHDNFLAAFPWVRSYVEKNGHLFLATMADGSIIEFEPAEPPLAATVLGEDVHTGDTGEMQEIILNRLFDRYVAEHNIAVSDEEIDSFVETMQSGMKAIGLTAEKELTDEEAAQVRQMQRNMGRSMIRQWKINRELYRQYGGRIIYQQLGPEPLDAFRQFLEERRDAGDFVIHRKTFKDKFWHYFIDDSIHDFYEPGSDEEAMAFSVAPWKPAAEPTEAEPLQDVPADAYDGGPLNWQVTGVAEGLRLRAEPSTSAEVLTTLPVGTILDNLGCQRNEHRVWCDVQQFVGGMRGYVAAEFLTAAVSPDGSVITGPDDSATRAGRGEFDATGRIPCAQFKGQPMTTCAFGVARKGGGYATVVISKPDGVTRSIYFRLGVAIGADTSQADGYPEFTAGKEADLFRIRIGGERYEIPEAVIFGG